MKTWVALVVWVILFGVMFLCSLAVDLEHNVIVWQWHGFTSSTVESLAIYVIALAAMVVIAPMTKTRIALRTMWALLLVLAVAGLD